MLNEKESNCVIEYTKSNGVEYTKSNGVEYTKSNGVEYTKSNGVEYTKSTMIKEYFDIYTEKIKEYGEKTCILYENGAFYEVYQLDNDYEKVGNASIISKILNDMKYTSKVIGKIEVNFIGFNTSCVDKFLPMLLSANYTVILVNQLEDSNNRTSKGNLKRGITKIYSPSLQPLDYNSGNLISLIIDIKTVKSSNKKNASMIHKLTTSVCCVKNEYNDIEITENLFTCKYTDTYSLALFLDELDRIIYRYFPKELQIKILHDDFWGIKNIEEYFINNYDNVMTFYLDKKDIRLYLDKDYQNKFFKEVYSHINFGLIDPIEYMNLESYELSILNLIYIIEFMGRHDSSYIKNLNLPNVIHENKNLILELNTIEQLNIISKNTQHKIKPESLFDVINFTKTSIGKRHLLSLLCKPFKNADIIMERYAITSEIGEFIKDIEILLKDMIDFEKLHRKMSLDILHPYEFVKLHSNYQYILKLSELLKNKNNVSNINLSEKDIYLFSEYINNYSSKFDLNLMKKIDLNTSKDEIINYFCPGVVPELDNIQYKITNIENKREALRLFYDSKINNKQDSPMIKLMYTENEGYSFICTKIRYQLLIQKLKDSNEKYDFKLKQTNNTTKFYPEELLNISTELLNYRELLHKKIKSHYLNIMSEYYKSYRELFVKCKQFIETIDVCYSNYKCKDKYRYVKPNLIQSDDAYFEAVELRHPIIERLGRNYIPNDITLEKNQNGMLLFGLNSSGKSSLLRAIGICIIMAQCGLYVPCKEFTYSPFHTVISQVDLTDNLFSGKSSYINETLGLKRILRCAGSHTLVLCDEMCKGTEHASSIGFVGATLKRLVSTNTKFFFTTHLHQLIYEETVIKNNHIKICHLSVNVRNNDIIFERKLMSGSGSDLYGLEVAKTILEDDLLIEDAFKIRNNLIDKKSGILGKKKSNYNSKKIMKKCEICSSTKNLETDHIIPQCDADSSGFLKSVGHHKNEEYNLATLCKECHLKKTLGKITINGYKDSLNGKFLDYTIR
jgi:DNA mismatch repair protein MutS